MFEMKTLTQSLVLEEKKRQKTYLFLKIKEEGPQSQGYLLWMFGATKFEALRQKKKKKRGCVFEQMNIRKIFRSTRYKRIKLR